MNGLEGGRTLVAGAAADVTAMLSSEDGSDMNGAEVRADGGEVVLIRAMVIGGTGLLGYHSVHHFLANGQEATVLALPPAPECCPRTPWRSKVGIWGKSAGYLCGTVIFIDGGTESAVRYGNSPAPIAVL